MFSPLFAASHQVLPTFIQKACDGCDPRKMTILYVKGPFFLTYLHHVYALQGR